MTRPVTQRWIVFVAPEGTSQADTIIVGPYRSYGRAQKEAHRIMRRYEFVAAIALPLITAPELDLDRFT